MKESNNTLKKINISQKGKKSGKRNKGKIALAVIGAVLLITVCSTGIMFREELGIIRSIHPISQGKNCYIMEVKSDYYFDKFLEAGGAHSDKEVSIFLTNCISKGFYQVDVTNEGLSCSTISAKKENNSHIWGRNYDWYGSVPIIVKCTPKEGYASIATCDFKNIIDSAETVPDNFINKMLAIAAVYVPMDGINEAGLCVADLEVNEGGMLDIDTEKPDLTVTTTIRLLLNRAATVEEAVHLLQQYDIHASGGISHHLSISDAQGASASIEFVNGEITVVNTNCITNFNLANKDTAAGGESAQKRYETLCAIYQENNGILSEEDVKNALSQVSQTEGTWTTQWSIVYQQDMQKILYYFGGVFDEENTFSVDIIK